VRFHKFYLKFSDEPQKGHPIFPNHVFRKGISSQIFSEILPTFSQFFTTPATLLRFSFFDFWCLLKTWQLAPGTLRSSRVSNSNCSEGQISTYKVTRELQYDNARVAVWRWCNFGGIRTLLGTPFTSYFLRNISWVTRASHFLQSPYVLLKGSCSVAGRELLNTSE